ncbi:MAG: FHA domain-containing protein [Anaerolineae bacterium]
MEREKAMLILREGGEAGQRWVLDKEKMLIGRGEDCDILLPDRQVSRHHALIRQGKGDYILEDCGSKNGTFVNGQEIQGPYALHDGDEIQIALRFKLSFVDMGETVPLFFSEEEGKGLRLDRESRRVWVKGKEITPPLSPAQYRFLELLYEGHGRVCNREEIVQAVWPGDSEEGISEQAIDALARRLRERLAELDPETQFIITVRGHGFRLENAFYPPKHPAQHE